MILSKFDTPGPIFCPFHGKLEQTIQIPMDYEHSMRVAKCKRCKLLYCNDIRIFQYEGARINSKNGIVKWSGYINKEDEIRPIFRDVPIYLITGREEIKTTTRIIFCKFLVAENLKLNAYYLIDKKKIYVSIDEFLSLNDFEGFLGDLQVIDEKHLLSRGKGRGALKNRCDVLKRIKKPIDIQQTAASLLHTNTSNTIPKNEINIFNAETQKAKDPTRELLHSIPGLSNSSLALYKCPFCGSQTNHKKTIHFLLYRNGQPFTGMSYQVSYCESCNLPIADQTQLKEIKDIAQKKHKSVPNILYVSDYTSKDILMNDALKEIRYLDTTPKQTYTPCNPNDTRFPYNETTWGKKFPNLTHITESKELLIYGKKCSCRKCEEKYKTSTTVSRTAEVFSIDGKRCKVNVQFCMGCGQYFMDSRSLISYHGMYGKFDFKYIISNDVYPNNPQTGGLFAEDSVLSRHGYNVKAKTPRIYRQDILACLMTYHIAEKHEIIALLNQFIWFHEKTHPAACDRWMEDIEFVNHFNIDNQKNVGLLRIRQAGKLSHMR